ncbi:DNA translocase FtsK 4TM domain-containing protein [Alisedimentitalea sp. MJ-SS2]|uniref:DNA translocase FtsK n=1 Tax=Aliisedimentitalea sp. MJ-SS2 TaxID=3049795 RepID=UPI002910274B|nr:DNA translocase FtsK 4TM domain-containing protein [Alisedimentitalea sp. MJ-SS2]MDU8929260.1 DNA translocase FtsK 4TM domain-containing protein [Alisedimentitalea sp. MJ-SS2]
MAYQARGRDPLLDSNMAEAIEKRGKELIGIALLLTGLAAVAMFWSYAPSDPWWMSATDAPVQNWLGRFGASIAAPMFMIVGFGAWGLAVVLLAWGLRFVLHRGNERAISRLIFAPIWIALISIYAATLTPGPGWTHSFGLGGLFGKTAAGSLLNLLPIVETTGLKILSLVLGVAVVAMASFVLGFTRPELRQFGRFLLVGLILLYASLMKLLGRTAQGAVASAQTLQAKNAERRERRAVEAAEAAEFAAMQAEQEAQAAAAHAAAHPAEVALPPEPSLTQPMAGHAPEHVAEKPGLLSRATNLIKRPEADPEPELIETEPHFDDATQAPSEDHIKARIADVIKSRVRQNPSVQVESVAPLTKGRGRGPDPLVLNTEPSHELPPEPPMTAMDLPPEPPLTAPQPLAYAPEPAPAEALPLQPAPAPAQAAIPVAQPKKVVQQPARKPIKHSTRAKAEAQPSLQFEENRPQYELPPLSLLANPVSIERHHLSDEALEENARMLEAVLDDYGVKGEIVSVRPGPVVTMYELEPAPGLKASRVIGLADDIARSMSALSARVSTVPGRSVIGIELPNDHREMVSFREILSSRDYGDGNHKLPLALGKDIGGDPMVANLAKMPHLLIAGTTGSGKSVAINTMILSLLYKLTPEECRLIMIDPKMLELSVYDGIPHLLSPVVTDPKKAVVALKWVVGEMEERYRKMSKMGVRNIDGYNSRVADALAKGETFDRTVQTGFDDETGEPIFETEEITPEKMPYIVVVVDEMADLMMVAGKEIEACIQRLAQMARASGIHLIMATQRPSVDVITGTIKANFPTRISFQVTSKIDSRTILGEMGAEQLLGMGDMLYMAGGARITRCHGPFVSDEEVEEIVTHLKAYGPPEYVGGVVQGVDDKKSGDIDAVLGLNTGGNTGGEDALYDSAVAIVIKDRKCSTSYIQRKLGIGYNKAARLVEQMEEEQLVSPANHVGKREILIPEQ